jgi:DNA replication protein DnaC
MIEKVYQNFKKEAELFFVTKFIDSPKLKTKYEKCLDVIFNVTGNMDHNKGLIAFNQKYGQGKSFFFDVVHHRVKRTKNKNVFVKTTAKDLCSFYVKADKNSDPQDQLERFISVKNLFIDDIGEELKDGKERQVFGNKLNVIRWVLLKRYELWIQKGWKTYGTTNLDIQQIAENYGGRVADRLMEMTYFEEFKFLDKGSFRQISESRKLTQEEIKANWKKFEKPEPKMERPNLEKFFNELIEEDESYFENKDNSFWSFVKDFLIEKELLNDEDFQKIDEAMLDASEMVLKRDTRETKRNALKHAPGNVRNAVIDRAIEEISRKDVFNTAENFVARRKFMELRESKHVFE